MLNRDFLEINSTRQCPICKQNNVLLLHTIEYPYEENRILPTTYKIVSCKTCGMIFDDLNITSDTLDKYYNQENKYAMEDIAGSGGCSAYDIKRFQRIIDLIVSQKITKDADIIDVGAGKGHLLQMLKENNFTNLCAVEKSQRCVEYMKKNATWKIIHASLDELNEKCSSDLIICSNIFEHILNPSKSLKILWEILRENGLLLIEVPDVCRYKDYFYKPYHYFDAEHINHFSLTSLRNLLISCGFEIVTLGTNELELSENITYPNCYVLCRKTLPTKYELKKDIESLTHIRPYLDKSSVYVKQQNNVLNSIANQEKCFIWGLGAYGLKLLNQGIFNNFNIIGLIDSDITKQGTIVQGHTVYSPKIVTVEKECTVCITSAIYDKEIRKQLQKMGFKGKIISF